MYRKNTSYLNIETLSNELTGLFQEKESNEVERIGRMISFFESTVCLSNELAGYFGEIKDGYKCGHCSVCSGQPAIMESSNELPNLENIDLDELTSDFISRAGSKSNIDNITNFLCGIAVPLFTKLKVRSLPAFASLEKYPYAEVKKILKENLM